MGGSSVMNSYIHGCLKLKKTTRLGSWPHMFLTGIALSCLWEILEMQKATKRWKSIFFFQITNKRMQAVCADKAIGDWGCFYLSAPPYQMFLFHSQGHVMILNTARATANASAFQAESQTREEKGKRVLSEVPSCDCSLYPTDHV